MYQTWQTQSVLTIRGRSLNEEMKKLRRNIYIYISIIILVLVYIPDGHFQTCKFVEVHHINRVLFQRVIYSFFLLLLLNKASLLRRFYLLRKLSLYVICCSCCHLEPLLTHIFNFVLSIFMI